MFLFGLFSISNLKWGEKHTDIQNMFTIMQSCHFLQECALLIFHCLTSPLGTRSRRRPPGASETWSKIREGRWQIIADSLLYWFKYAFGNNWCMNMYMIELDCMTDLTDITWPILISQRNKPIGWEPVLGACYLVIQGEMINGNSECKSWNLWRTFLTDSV